MINYSLAAQVNPQKRNEPAKYYAKVQSSGKVDIDRLAEEIAYSTALTDGDVLNAIRALIRQINYHIADGKIVDLENLGTFYATVESEGAATEEDFDPATHIKDVNIRFRPGKGIEQKLNLAVLEFRKVKPLGDGGGEEEEAPEGTA